jgi:addiction module HigA family antidote
MVRHPGYLIRMEVIDRLRLTIREAADALGVTRQALSTLLNGRCSLTAEMAIRIDKAFGIAMEELMRLQLAYDIERARVREGEIRVARFVPKGPPPAQPNLL